MKKYQLSQLELKKLHQGLEHLETGNAEDILLDHSEFCRRFGIGPRTSYNWRKKGLLKCLRIQQRVFFRLSEVRKFLQEQEFSDQ